ncbi:cupin domain-containing protein [Simiduia agarivorans]|uniref:(S)-ureidoglycine aminohydrolase cupin domain-containing protein n=1 Tax=Simiduia agarivorans (strain DSM 21679 / JCM 13881 / BCRC 17597 / SA1) TaxID=1117647 RepID=K4L2W3_SIMAS|nr:cupin domain-containing protein [Simiduia agarivorans]AFV00538.2 hypothetical protein M5M_17035 [Simiduia agarivorans SA1 = DSM 21679]
MIKRTLQILLLLLPCTVAASPQPVLLPANAVPDALLAAAGKPYTEHTDKGPQAARDALMFTSSDQKVTAGVYQANAGKFTVNEPYGVDEFMWFLEGKVTLTSTDGTVTEINAGDAVLLPKEWTGVWESTDYKKVYVIYSPTGGEDATQE